MENNYPEIRELLQQKADYQARLNLLPYDGSPEIKEQGGKQYLYIRKRIASRLTSEYVDVYSDTLYQTLLRNARDPVDREAVGSAGLHGIGAVRPGHTEY